jgi:hypothetical protein
MTEIISPSSVKEVYIWSKLPAHGSSIHTSFYRIQMYGGAQGGCVRLTHLEEDAVRHVDLERVAALVLARAQVEDLAPARAGRG